jgi:hypothetical protein
MPTPPPPRKRPVSLWWYVGGAIAILCIVCSIADKRTAAQENATLAAFTADLQQGKMDTPEAFQARCGKADWSERKGAMVVLGYQRTDIRVKFPPHQPPQFSRVFAVETSPGEFRDASQSLSEESIFEALRCKGAQ